MAREARGTSEGAIDFLNCMRLRKAKEEIRVVWGDSVVLVSSFVFTGGFGTLCFAEGLVRDCGLLGSQTTSVRVAIRRCFTEMSIVYNQLKCIGSIATLGC
jgi:hypothetical protein